MKKYLDKILFYWFLAGSIVPNIILSATEPLTLTGSITNILLPLGIIGLLATSTRHVGRMVFMMFPYTFFAAFQIVLLSLYGNGIISVDMFLNVVTTNSTEVSELLGRLGPSLLAVSILYLVPLILGGYCIYQDRKLSNTFVKRYRFVFIGVTVVGLGCLLGSYSQKSDYDVRRDLYPVNIGYNLYLTYNRCEQTRNFFETSAEFKFNSETSRDKEMEEKYILVIGESSRAQNWELLGYERLTNPKLSERDDVVIYSRAFSESNTTHKSVPMLLSNVEAQTYADEMFKVKSLISAFKECGYDTTFISNQMPNHSFIEFFGSEADTTIYVKHKETEANGGGDANLLPVIKDCIGSNHKKQLIVVHTYGSHFNYRDRYSQQDSAFHPDNFPKATKAYRSQLINAYDNTIVATDRFLNSVIGLLEDRKCVSGLLYAPDHGEDIFDDGIHFLHASPTPTLQQLHVPLIAWLSPEYTSQFSKVIETLRNNSAKIISTSRSFCPTAISIAGIRSDKIDYSDALTSPSFTSKELYYLNDHNKPLPFKPE